MNDFTKEELEMIRYGIQCVIIQNDPWENAALKSIHCTLKNKIENMIDTHCDHEPSDAHYEQFRWQLCGKCGVQYK